MRKLSHFSESDGFFKKMNLNTIRSFSPIVTVNTVMIKKHPLGITEQKHQKDTITTQSSVSNISPLPFSAACGIKLDTCFN